MSTIKFSQFESEKSVDIAIIGAGISGLYCAWRLIKDDPSRTIVIVERLNRRGGRLDTDIVEIKPGQTVREEEGGMRFNYDMLELMNLNKALGLCDQIVDFPMGSEGGTNRFNLRGCSFTVAEAEDGNNMIWSQIYDLKPEEVGLSPTELVSIAFDNVLYENGALGESTTGPDFWTKFRENNNVSRRFYRLRAQLLP